MLLIPVLFDLVSTVNVEDRHVVVLVILQEIDLLLFVLDLAVLEQFEHLIDAKGGADELTQMHLRRNEDGRLLIRSTLDQAACGLGRLNDFLRILCGRIQ